MARRAGAGTGPAAPLEVTARLPRGRHGLTAEQVVSSQRQRMFRALAETMANKGYAATSVADVINGAGVSRETFYQQFTSKQHCFSEAFDDAAARLFGAVESEIPATGSPAERFDHLLGVYLASIAAAPALARVCLVEVYAAGPELLDRRAVIQQRFAARLIDLLGLSGAQARFACDALVAAVSAMVVARLAVGDIAGLRGLRRPFSGLVRAALAHPGAAPTG